MTYFFDLDGTITDSQEGIINCVKYALKSHGIAEPDYEKLKTYIGPPLVNAFMEVNGVDEETAVELLNKYRERYSKYGVFECKLYDGISKLLKSLSEQGHTLAIVTGKPEHYAKIIAENLGVKKYFNYIVGPSLSNTEEEKDSLIRRALSLADTKYAVMIGDRKFDIQGAKMNNISSVAVMYGFGTPEELKDANADYYAETVKDLHNLLLSM